MKGKFGETSKSFKNIMTKIVVENDNVRILDRNDKQKMKKI